MTRNAIRDGIGAAMKSKGFHDDGTVLVDGTLFRLSLAQTEACEAMQEVKRHWGKPDADAEKLRDVVAEELADFAIRVYDCAAFGGFDLDRGNVLYDPLSVGPTERVGLIVRIGKLTSLVGDAFAVVEQEEDLEVTEFLDFTTTSASDVLHTALVHAEALCQSIGRDLNRAIDLKMEKNMKRPDRYGTPDEQK